MAIQLQKREKQFGISISSRKKPFISSYLRLREKVVSGTVQELADKYGMELNYMVGFLDGIFETKNRTQSRKWKLTRLANCRLIWKVLYHHMVEAGADWLYELPEWDELLTPERRKELYREQGLVRYNC